MSRILLAVLLASLSIGTAVVLSVYLSLSGAVTSAVVVVCLLGSVWLADRRRVAIPHGLSLDQMERDGLLEDVAFTATRAFGVEEYEDEGSHYLIALTDGTVLYVRGQYLEQYEPSLRRHRRFPCTEFRLVRHKPSGDFIDVRCAGTPIEPETIFPPFPSTYYLNDDVFVDGQIIQDRDFDALKAEIAALSQ